MSKALTILLLLALFALGGYLIGSKTVSISVDRQQLRDQTQKVVDRAEDAGEELARDAKQAGKVISSESEEAAHDIRDRLSEGQTAK